MKYKELVLSNYNNRTESGPYMFAFCFPKEGPIVIKGMFDEVYSHVKNMSECHYRLVYFGSIRVGGKSLSNWSSNCWNKVTIIEKRKDGRKGWEINDKFVRTIPQRYLKEFDN